MCVRAWVIIAFSLVDNHKKEADFHCIPRFLPENKTENLDKIEIARHVPVEAAYLSYLLNATHWYSTPFRAMSSR